jgi:hypothetical protein
LSGNGKNTDLPSLFNPMKSVAILTEKWYNIKDMYFRAVVRDMISICNCEGMEPVQAYSVQAMEVRAVQTWAGSYYG